MAKSRAGNKWCMKRIIKNFKTLLHGRNRRRCSEPCTFSCAERLTDGGVSPLPLEAEHLRMLESAQVHGQKLTQVGEVPQWNQQEELPSPQCDSPASFGPFAATSDGDSSRSSTCTSAAELEDTLVERPCDDEDLHLWPNNELDFLDEWTIERRDLSLERIITTSEKETVYRAYWHGSVTVHTRRASTEQEYQDFVSEVQTLCRIRHEKIQLFMGVCFDLTPDRVDLAIVVDQMKGDTLHSLIHLNRRHYDYQSTMSILNQVAQGMEYLHAKNIAHPLLTSQSIGIYRGRACITMWAPYSHSRSVSAQELTYIPPEALKSLVPNKDGTLCLPECTSFEANVYSFGTVAYELATMERPYKGLTILPIIWEVGNGHFQSLAQIGSWKLKGIVASCWMASPTERATFEGIVENIERNMTPNSPRPYAGDVKSAFSFSEPSQLQRLGL